MSLGFFALVRHQDPSGISGTGVVAYGALYPSGKVTLAWHVAGKAASIAVFDSLADLEAIHGHAGATQVRWLWRAAQRQESD